MPCKGSPSRPRRSRWRTATCGDQGLAVLDRRRRDLERHRRGLRHSALLLRSTDLVRFLPDGKNGNTGSITYRAWDQTAGTAGNEGRRLDQRRHDALQHGHGLQRDHRDRRERRAGAGQHEDAAVHDDHRRRPEQPGQHGRLAAWAWRRATWT